MDEIRRRNMRLAVKLTHMEMVAKQEELVRWTQVRAENEGNLEARLAEMREEKKGMEAEILSAASYARRAADVIQAGEERRDVEVVDYFDTSNIVTVRTDTGETVATRPANDDERQMLLPPVAAAVEAVCTCEDPEVASIDCPIHGPEGSGQTQDDVDDGEPEEEEDEDGSTNEPV